MEREISTPGQRVGECSRAASDRTERAEREREREREQRERVHVSCERWRLTLVHAESAAIGAKERLYGLPRLHHTQCTRRSEKSVQMQW